MKKEVGRNKTEKLNVKKDAERYDGVCSKVFQKHNCVTTEQFSYFCQHVLFLLTYNSTKSALNSICRLQKRTLGNFCHEEVGVFSFCPMNLGWSRLVLTHQMWWGVAMSYPSSLQEVCQLFSLVPRTTPPSGYDCTLFWWTRNPLADFQVAHRQITDWHQDIVSSWAQTKLNS